PNTVRVFAAVSTEAATAPKACAPESSCKDVTESSALCLYDADVGCIRKYASLCHLKIASCRQNKVIGDYSADYCSMETYLCELTPEYERWTIFFGHEK
ncbi:hypothetical protein KR093_010550, partial [Drosophila rubida]